MNVIPNFDFLINIVFKNKLYVYNSNWIEYWISVPKVIGSNPIKRIY